MMSHIMTEACSMQQSSTVQNNQSGVDGTGKPRGCWGENGERQEKQRWLTED